MWHGRCEKVVGVVKVHVYPEVRMGKANWEGGDKKWRERDKY